MLAGVTGRPLESHSSLEWQQAQNVNAPSSAWPRFLILARNHVKSENKETESSGIY